MATYTKEFLSGSTNGIGIVVHASTSGSASTIHEAVSGTAAKDEVWMYAYNMHTADLVLTIEKGGTSNPMKVTIPYQSGRVPLEPGLPTNNSVKTCAYAGSAGMIIIEGYVNRITD
jgi:hypothetical protein